MGLDLQCGLGALLRCSLSLRRKLIVVRLMSPLMAGAEWEGLLYQIRFDVRVDVVGRVRLRRFCFHICYFLLCWVFRSFESVEIDL